MRKLVAEKIAGQVADWGHAGLIDPELSATLQSRYATEVSMGRVFVRWLGFLALTMLGMSVLGFIGMAMGEAAQFLAPFALGCAAYVSWTKGVAMASDPQQQYATSGAVFVTFGLTLGFAALMAAYLVVGGGSGRYSAPVIMAITAGAAVYTAYRFGLRWPLLLGVLLGFHALGNMHSYGGSGSYFMGIQDERLTLFVAVISIAFGLWHEQSLERDSERRDVGFGQVYIVFGLLYANMTLLFLSLPRLELMFTLVFSAACIAQIVLGARLHDGRFTGFGIVFLSINIYTRMFEFFWDEVSKGAFFLTAGTIAMLAGTVFELRARNLRRESLL
jgi:hypothetical protein